MRLPAARHLPLLLATLLVAAGCVYKVDIQQGNFIEDKQVAQVETGMTRSQVRFLLGTPMVADSFDQNRWDYVYYLKWGKTEKVMQRHLVVWFDGDKVVRIEKPDALLPPTEAPKAESTPAG